MSTTTEPTYETDEEYLRRLFPVGSTARTILRHASDSGMTRWISVLGPDDRDVSRTVASVLGLRLGARHSGIKVEGCGMDMGFHLVYSLSRTLYPQGHPCTGHDRNGPRGARRCPSNDHSNDRTMSYRRGRKHRDGGYAINQTWL